MRPTLKHLNLSPAEGLALSGAGYPLDEWKLEGVTAEEIAQHVKDRDADGEIDREGTILLTRLGSKQVQFLHPGSTVRHVITF